MQRKVPLIASCMLSRFSCVRLCTTPWTVALQAPLSMGFFQARILEWVAICSSREPSLSRDQTHIFCVSCIGRWVLYNWPLEKPWYITHMWNKFFFKVELTETESRKVISRGLGRGDRLAKRYKLSAVRWIRSTDLTYNMVTIVDNVVL